MATAYLAEIREVQPEGPYMLGGYSGGGLVAFEMAQQLTAAGEKIALLVMFDTFPPHDRRPRHHRRHAPAVAARRADGLPQAAS